MKCSPGIFRNTGKPGADAQEDGVEAFQEFIHGFGAADDRIDFDLDPHAFQEVTFLGDDGLGQTEFRDAVEQHAAGAVQGLEDVDFVAFLDQVAGHGQAGGTGAHYRHLLAGGLGLGGQDVLAVLALVIGGEALQVADGHRGVFFADDAHAFALDFLGADPAAHRGQGVFLPEFADGALKVAFLDAFR